MVIDADVLAREVVAPGTPGLAAVVDGVRRRRCSPPTASWTGRRWARSCSPTTAAPRRLEAIMHPLVRARAAELEAAAPAGRASSCTTSRCSPRPVRPTRFDAVIVVDVPAEVAGRADGRATAAGPARTPQARIAAQADPRGAAGRRDVRHRQHRDARRPPRPGRRRSSTSWSRRAGLRVGPARRAVSAAVRRPGRGRRGGAASAAPRARAGAPARRRCRAWRRCRRACAGGRRPGRSATG